MAQSASVRITGDVSQAIAALESLGIKAEDTGAKVEASFGDKVAGSMEGITGKLANLTSGFPIVGAYFEELHEKLGDAETAGQKTSAAISELGKALTVGLAAGTAAAAVESLHLAENYQKATASLAAGAGISMKAADAIGNAFVATAGSSTFSAQEIMEAYSPVAAQLATVQGHALDSSEAMTAMKAAMDLAEGSGTSLTAATSSLADVMQAFGVNTSGAAQASDVLFNAAEMTGTGVSQVATSMQRMRTQLGAAAPPLNQLGGLLVDLTEHGETGRAAMSVMSSALTGVIAPTKATTAEQQKLGVSFVTATGQLKPFGTIIAELQPVIAGMGNAQASATLKALGFGSASTKLLSIIQAGPEAFEKATAAVSKAGSAQEAAEKQAKTLHGTMEKLEATGEDIGVKFGDMLIPILSEVGAVLANLINWFERNRSVAEILGVVIGSVTGLFVAFTVAQAAASVATGAWAAVSGVAAAATGVFSAAMTVLGAVTGLATAPLLGIILVVAAIGVGIYELVTHWSAVWNAIKSMAEDAWKFIKNAFEDGVKFVESVWQELVQVLLVFTSQLWHTVTSFFQNMWSDVVSVVSSMVNAVVDFFIRMWNEASTAVMALVNAVVGFFTNMWNAVTGAVSAGIGAVVNWFEGLPGRVLGAIGSLASAMFSFGAHIIEQLIAGIGSEAGSLASSISSTIGGALSHLPGGGELATILGVKKGAAGGYVTSPTLALIGEAGPEYVIPASLLTNAPALPGLPTAGGGGGGGGGGAQAVQLNMQMDKTTVATVLIPDIRTLLLQQQRRNSTRVGLS